jgi:TPR repeat protein
MNNLHAMDSIGDLYRFGYGVKRDHQAAMNWYLKAANAGNEFSQLNLGIMYFEGLGTEINYELALKWFHDADRNGKEEASEYIRKVHIKQALNKTKNHGREENKSNHQQSGSFDTKIDTSKSNMNNLSTNDQNVSPKPQAPPKLPVRPTQYTVESPSSPQPDKDPREIRLKEAEKATKAAEDKIALLMAQLELQNSQIKSLTKPVSSFKQASDDNTAKLPEKKKEPIKFFTL